MAVERFEILVETRGTQRVQRDLSQIGRSAKSANDALRLMRSALVVLATVRVVRQFTDLVDSFTNMRNQIKLVTNSTDELNAVFESLNQLSTRTRTDLAANVLLFTRTARSTTQLNKTYRELLEVTEAVALATKISGATTIEATQAIRQFGQGLAAGALQGDELRSVAEGLPKLANLIGKEFGVTGGQLIAFNKANPGILKTERILKALQKETAALKLEFKDFAPTIADGFTLVNNALVVYLGRMNEATGAGAFLSRSLASIAQNIGLVVNALLAFGGIVVFNLLTRQVAQLGTTLASVGGAAVGTFATMGRAAGVVLSPIKLIPAAFAGVGTAAVATGGIVATAFRASGAAVLGIVKSLRGAAVGFTMLATVSGGALSALRAIAALSLASVFGAIRTALLGAAMAARAFSLAILTNPLFLTGAAVIAGLVAAFYLLRKPIMDLIGSLDGLKVVWKNAVSAVVALLSVLIDDWDLLPGAIADISVRAVNGMIEIFEKGVNGVTSLLNSIGANIKPVDLGRFTTDYAGQADALKGFLRNQFNKAFEEGIDKTTLGRTIDDVVAFVEGKSPALMDVLMGKPKGAGEGGGMADKVEELKGRMRSMVASLSPLAEARFKFEDLERSIQQAAKAGIDLQAMGLSGDELRRRVGRDIAGVGNAAVETGERIKLLQAQFKAGAVSANELAITQRRLSGELFEGGRAAVAAVSPLEDFRQRLQDSKDELMRVMELSRQSVAVGGPAFEFNMPETQRRTVRELIGVGNAVTDYRERLAILNSEEAKSVATAAELAVKRRELAAAFGQDADSLIASVSPAAAAAQQLAAAKLTIDKALSQGQTLALPEPEIFRRLTRELVGAGNAAEVYADKMGLLRKAHADASISLAEFESAARKARLEMLENATTMGAGFQRAFLKLEDSVANASLAAEDLLTKAFDAAGSAVDSFVRTGKLSLSELAADFASFFLKLGTQQVLVGGANLLGLKGGGVGTSGGGFGIGSLLGELFGFANGGSFRVGAGFPSIPGGMDNRLVAFKARDGEQVQVSKPGQPIQGQPVQVYMTINTPDADSFMRSQGQIAARMGAATNRALRRNG